MFPGEECDGVLICKIIGIVSPLFDRTITNVLRTFYGDVLKTAVAFPRKTSLVESFKEL